MTLVDIAKMTGVSKSTVSKVLNRPGCLSPETVRIVEKTMREMKFNPRPNKRRRQKADFSSCKLENVALLFPDPDAASMKTLLSGRLIHGINDVLFKKQINFLLTHYEGENLLPSCIRNSLVDGVIIRGGACGADVLHAIAHLPVVCAFYAPLPPEANIDMVLPDNETVGSMACAHLMDEGAEQLIFIDVNAGGRPHPEFGVRRLAFGSHATANGIRVVEMAHDEKSDIAPTVERIRSASSKKTGVFIPGGDIVFEQIAWELKKDIREGEILLTGCYNNDDRHRITGVGGTVIDLQVEKIGQAAAEQLIAKADNPGAEQRKILIKPTLIKAG